MFESLALFNLLIFFFSGNSLVWFGTIQMELHILDLTNIQVNFDLDNSKLKKIIIQERGEKLSLNVSMAGRPLSICHICRRRTPGALILNHLQEAKTTVKSWSLTTNSKFNAICCFNAAVLHPNMSQRRFPCSLFNNGNMAE